MSKKPVLVRPVAVNQFFSSASISFEGSCSGFSVSAADAVELARVMRLALASEEIRSLLGIELVKRTGKRKTLRRVVKS